jgi:predicted  nucleic acid-binding Zn-ribbon protein
MGISDRLNTIRHRIAGVPHEEHEAQLLQLFWNRAQLKKELARLQDERHKLLGRLHAQETETEIAREQLAALEHYLGNPEAGPHALVYFQLRGLWRTCASKLERFSQQLYQQQADRERRRQRIEFDQARQRQLAELDRRIDEVRTEAETLSAHIKLVDAKLASLRGIWNYFKRRKLREAIAADTGRLDALALQLTDLSDDRAEVAARTPGELTSLSVDGRRVINTAVIAYAQHLVVALSAGGLAMLSKETSTKGLLEVHYGDREECVRLLALLRDANLTIEQKSADLGSLKERTDALRAGAAYRSDADTVPLTDSIGTLPVPTAIVSGLETANRTGINVLVDDYWDLYKALVQ